MQLPGGSNTGRRRLAGALIWLTWQREGVVVVAVAKPVRLAC